MGLIQLNLEGWNKIETAIKVIQQNEPPEGYYVANSGGKDSGVVLDLCKKSGVKFDAHYNVSPIDPPEVYKFLKQYHTETQWEYNARGFWSMVDKRGLPTRQHRWCCEVIKEAGGSGRTVVTGIRWAESVSRRSRCMVDVSRQDETKKYLHAIICWTDVEVWEYTRLFNLPYLSLYDRGWGRVGCIGCPFGNNSQRIMQLRTYSKIALNWKYANERFCIKHPNSNIVKLLGSSQRVWDWWLSGKSVKAFLNEQQGRW